MSADHSTMKVYFPIRPEIEILGDDLFRVVNGFHVVIEEDGQETIVHEIPHGFDTDLSSTPRLPVVYLLYGGIGKAEGILHDDLYRHGIYPREWCDAVYYHALLANPAIPAWKAERMYAAVQAFGGKHYNQGDTT